jgi:uncharacterized protein
MKKLILFLLVCTLGLAAFSQESKNIQISKKMLKQFQKTEYSAIPAVFDETMKGALPADKLKAVWESLLSQCGKFTKAGDATESTVQIYQLVKIPLEFEKVKLEMQVSFNDKNQVAGLYFVPYKE